MPTSRKVGVASISSELASLNARKEIPNESSHAQPLPHSHSPNHDHPADPMSGISPSSTSSRGDSKKLQQQPSHEAGPYIATAGGKSKAPADAQTARNINTQSTMDQTEAEADNASTNACKRRKLNNRNPTVSASTAALPEISLRKLIPPKDCPRMRKRSQQANVQEAVPAQQSTTHTNLFSTIQDTPTAVLFDWSVVIARAKSHPHEAAHSYFGSVDSAENSDNETTSAARTNTTNNAASASTSASASSQQQQQLQPLESILTYKPLHAMLKYDPPLDAVESVLRAHPEAALDVTFEGTALKIACESRVKSILALRLLLVAEMAMRRRLVVVQHELEQQQQEEVIVGTKPVAEYQPLKQGGGRRDVANEARTRKEQYTQQQKQPPSHDQEKPAIQVEDVAPPNIFTGHNPIRWITERRTPVKTAAMLLKWFPIGAFQRPWDADRVPTDGYTIEEEEVGMDSPLIDIVDDFARDHHHDEEDETNNDGDDESDAIYYDSESDDEDSGLSNNDLSVEQHQSRRQQQVPRTYQQQEHLRKERRWEKFLHILYATDLALHSTKTPTGSLVDGNYASSGSAGNLRHAAESSEVATSAASAGAAPGAATKAESSAAATDSKQSEATTCQSANQTTSSNSPITSFRPVHAWIRVITSAQPLGLERCRPYGVWSVLRVMERRIPNEFTARDTADGNCTVFETLAEAKADDCKLCLEEMKDVVECLMDADYRSAFLPRKSDGRLIGHVALENGWPCKDLFSRKKSATCA